MRESLYKRCQLFITNRDIVKSAFGWENSYLYPLCASLFACEDVQADAEVMKKCRTLLKEKTGIFSSFRGTSKMATITMLALSENPAEKLDRMLTVYKDLREVFYASDYLTVAAAVIADMAEPQEFQRIATETRSIYDRMKAQHPFLTSSEDSAFAALLALSRLDAARAEEEMERCYSILKREFFSSNAVQSLSHVLSLGEGTAEEKCNRALYLFNYLKRNGYKYGTSYELATLGVLALLDIDEATLAREIMEVDDFLSTQKGFGFFGIGSKQRLMYAGMLTMCDYVPRLQNKQSMHTAALSSVISLVIAEQAAICASIAAANAAAAASSSSS